MTQCYLWQFPWLQCSEARTKFYTSFIINSSSFFVFKSIGALFLTLSNWLAYCQTVCMFHYSNVNWAVSVHCCAQRQKLKRWAFHMGHVIEHWLWMTTFIGLPVMRSVWYCDCVKCHLCPGISAVWLIHALWSGEVLTSLASLEEFASKSWILNRDGFREMDELIVSLPLRYSWDVRLWFFPNKAIFICCAFHSKLNT